MSAFPMYVVIPNLKMPHPGAFFFLPFRVRGHKIINLVILGAGSPQKYLFLWRAVLTISLCHLGAISIVIL